jgi:NADH:ubiquinone oxidoreductase subunit F (NADH-binding)
VTAPAAVMTDQRAGHHASIDPRLVVAGAEAGPLSLERERELGTYGPACTDDLVGELEVANLRGRGGAAFPAHVKWRAVAAADGPRVVVANGEEGEPSSGKDRWLLTHRPHLVLDGLFRAVASTGAERAIVYLAHPETVAAVRTALAELGDTPVAVEVHTVEPSYVAGEETAVCRAIDGGPALPTAKPPRPFERGVGGRPTLVANVETLAHTAWIAVHGADAYRRYGTGTSPGTALVTLAGACLRPGVYEVPYGLTIAELFDSVGGGLTSSPSAFVMGGWFGGVLNPRAAGVACCFDAVRAAGSGLGCAAITAVGDDEDPVAVAASIAAWYADESAGQCGVCIKGTAAIRDTFALVRDGRAGDLEAANLARWGAQLPGRGACAFLDGAAALARTVVTEFPDRIAARPRTNDQGEL